MVLKKRDMASLKTNKPRGILNADALAPAITHARYAPTADLVPFVEHFWTAEWDLSEDKVVETLPHPSVHIILEPGLAQLVGVTTTRFHRRLHGSGRVLGVKFRPGGFRPFVTQPVSSFSEKTIALTTILGVAAEALDQRVLLHEDHRAAIAAIEAFLHALHPNTDENVDFVARVVSRIYADRHITKVEQVAMECGMGIRSLQRLFDDYVGVSPKWVIQRYRLHEAAELIATTNNPNWPGIAVDLGYADQAHFIRDFKKIVGLAPDQYFRSLSSVDQFRSRPFY